MERKSVGPDKQTHHYYDFGEWLDKHNISICFVKELTTFEMKGLENLNDFSNSRSNYKGKVFDTLIEATQQSNPIIVPYGSFVDWNKIFHKEITFPCILDKTGYGIIVFKSTKEVTDWIDSAKSHLCPWPTEQLLPKNQYTIPKNDIINLVSVANGLSAIHKAIVNPQTENFFFVDISSRQLEFTEWLIKTWDGIEPFHLFQKRFSNKDIIENRIWLYESADMSVADIQDALIRMQNSQFIQQDITEYKHPEPAIYYISNALTYWMKSLTAPIIDLKQFEKEWCEEREIVFTSSKKVRGFLL